MIGPNMNLYEVWEQKKNIDSWGNEVITYELYDVIRVSISTIATTNISQNVQYSEVSHIGLTLTKGLKKGQILHPFKGVYLNGTYKLDGELILSGISALKDVKYVIEKPPTDTTRYTQVFLKEVI